MLFDFIFGYYSFAYYLAYLKKTGEQAKKTPREAGGIKGGVTLVFH